MTVHVVPVDDWIDHVVDGDGAECPCCPDVQWIDPETGLPYPNGALVTHNAVDGRGSDGQFHVL